MHGLLSLAFLLPLPFFRRRSGRIRLAGRSC